MAEVGWFMTGYMVDSLPFEECNVMTECLNTVSHKLREKGEERLRIAECLGRTEGEAVFEFRLLGQRYRCHISHTRIMFRDLVQQIDLLRAPILLVGGGMLVSAVDGVVYYALLLLLQEQGRQEQQIVLAV